MQDHLAHRYGTDVEVIADICREVPDAATPLAEAPAYLRAEIIFAIRYEGALHLDDLLDRRTRISYEYAHLGLAATEEVAQVAQTELDWTDAAMSLELEAYRASVEAYESAVLEADDAAASRTRAEAKDLRPLPSA